MDVTQGSNDVNEDINGHIHYGNDNVDIDDDPRKSDCDINSMNTRVTNHDDMAITETHYSNIDYVDVVRTRGIGEEYVDTDVAPISDTDSSDVMEVLTTKLTMSEEIIAVVM